jgi:exopolyphosphatase/guanosine-5'-triphosphate,3'-diphosphate pyrophosphatase
MKQGTLLAAIDLGSNSFRLEIGRYELGQIQRIEYLKETVRQGSGFDENRNLSQESMVRGWECLARFAERIAGFHKSQVRAVATQTLREAKNREAFIKRGYEILGFPIEIISGSEEARLIYQGVSHLLPTDHKRRLVIDIGGRSTELVLGQNLQAHVTGSFRVGSVAWSMKYFPDGVLSESAFSKAEIAAKAVLEEAIEKYPPTNWDTAYGASGTVGAVADVLQSQGWPAGEVSMDGLNWLIKQLVRASHVDHIRLQGLKEDRRAVIGGGASVLRALMQLLAIDKLHVAQGALRQGVLFEMVERDDRTTDVRDISIQRLAQKFALDQTHSQRVSKVALQFFNKSIQDSGYEPHLVQRLKRKLSWAAAVHEVGFAISHSDYHKHGAYILENADLLGFSMQELHRLSLLVLGHRGKLRKLDADFQEAEFVKMLIALRLSVILCHARKTPNQFGLEFYCHEKNKIFTLEIDADWIENYPQSMHLLRQEVIAWQKTPWVFALTRSSRVKQPA